MANQSKLKAWVRYDGTGRVISGGPIFQVNKPKVGNWKQIDANLCCNSTLTTTTTQGGGGVTPTAWVAKAADRNFDSELRACNNPNAIILLYTSTNTFPIPPNTPLYTDPSLETLISTTYPDYVNVSINDWVFRVQFNGYTNPGEPCSNFNTTTTTSTTQAPVFSIQNQRWGNTSGDACGAVNPPITLYTTGPLQSGAYPQDGNVIYLDQALTQLVQYPFIASPGIGRLLDCNNGVLSNQRSCF